MLSLFCGGTPVNPADRHAPAPSASEPPIRFAGSELGAKRHICAFFNSPDEEYRVLLPFIKEGIERGEKAFHVVDPKLCDEHVRRLESFGIDVSAARQDGQFDLFDWNAVYMPDGRFDQKRMIAAWDAMLSAARQQGFVQTRLVAHMEWTLEDRPGTNDLLEYEASCNYLFDGGRDPIVCTYDITKYSGAFIMDVLRTHPTSLLGGMLQENPFYVRPDLFLRELRERDADRNSAPA